MLITIVSRPIAMIAKLSRMPRRVCTSPHTATARADRSLLRIAVACTQSVKSLIYE